MTAATKAVLGEKLRNNLHIGAGGGGGASGLISGEKRKLDSVDSSCSDSAVSLSKSQKFSGAADAIVKDDNADEFAAFLNSPANGGGGGGGNMAKVKDAK
jgi:hypothetical protein